jgi:hypothetical protein
MIDLKAGCRITLDHGSRIYCGLRGSKGCRCNETIDIGDEDRHQYPNTDDGLRGCFKLVKNLEVPTMVETYRAQIPLLEAGDQQGPLKHTTHPGKAEPSRCPHQDHTHDDHTKLEEKLEGWNEWEVQLNEWVNEEWMLE